VGESKDPASALVHASISGTVEEITETTNPAGQPVAAVSIKSDQQDAWLESAQGSETALLSLDEVGKASREELLGRVQEGGIVRSLTMGLPLHLDLSPPSSPRSYMHMTAAPVVRPIDTLIIKAVDFDPPVAPNQACLAGDTSELELGVTALTRITGADRVILALPSGGSSDQLTETAEKNGWELAKVNAGHYPYGLNNLVIHSLLGREVATPYGDPRDVGVVIQPLLTALDVGRVLGSGRPVTERVFSVCGDVGQPQTFRVRLGTPVAEVIDAAGGLSDDPGKVILGGPMMGYAHFDLNTPVTKETSGVFVQAAANVQTFSNHPCIHCGRCMQACPVRLEPGELGKLCEFGQYDLAAERNLFHCIECGVCAYVCPAKRPMVQLLRLGKSEVLAGRMEQ
jgi:electron transport complex protein RnfC